MAEIVDSAANRAAQGRLTSARGSVYAAFDGLECGFDHDEVLDFLLGSVGFQAIPEEHRGKVAGMVMACGIVLVERDREQRRG